MEHQLNPLSGAIGAEVLGIDLAPGLESSLATSLNRVLLEHIVLVIRDQRLTPSQYVRAMAAFGKPARQNHASQLMAAHPEIWIIDSREAEIAPDGRRLLFGANCWHTDHTNLRLPPKITALYAVELPPSGGDTCFANACDAYDALPPETRRRIDPLSIVYGADRHRAIRDEDREAFTSGVAHPLVRTHPETRRRALYCHPLKAQYIEGMEPRASFALIDELLAQALLPELIYRHRWRSGDLVLIDNRACLHLAQADYDPDAGRVMHRIIIEGDRPF